MHTSANDTLYAAAFWMLERERSADAAVFFRMLLLSAPADERGFLGLAKCHEDLGQDEVALDIYLAGSHAAERRVRCHIGCARVAVRQNRDDLAAMALEQAAALADDEDLRDLVNHEQRGLRSCSQ